MSKKTLKTLLLIIYIKFIPGRWRIKTNVGTCLPLGENFMLQFFVCNSTTISIMMVSVVSSFAFYTGNALAMSLQRTTTPKPQCGNCVTPSSPPSPSAFPPTPLGREEVARWLTSLGSNVPLCNMKPWVWKKAREAPSGFYFYFLLVAFVLFRQTSISFRVVSNPRTSSSGVDASNHAGDPCQKLTASHTLSQC